MASPRIAKAHEIVDDLRAALDAAGLQAVTATLDAGLIASGARDGIVVVAAPKLDFSAGYGAPAAIYEVHVIAGPADNYLVAWDRLDTIVEALVAGQINLNRGEPGGYADERLAAPLPAYTLTLNDLD
jgi:hypothetical protein